MAEQTTAFTGSIPDNYDRYLGPLFFHGYADDLAARVPLHSGMRVLETACGTGIVTERLAARLAGQGTLMATDLNEPMVAHAAKKGIRAEWRQADATALPFDDATFDAVVCQFGLMFYPDKARGVREAFRVLRSGGHYVFNVWDGLHANPAARIVHETMAAMFGADAPQFFTVPHSLSDVDMVTRWLNEAGFVAIATHALEKTGESPSAEAATRGLLEGTPLYHAILERKSPPLADVKAAVARALVAEHGTGRPLRTPLRAFVYAARKP